MSTEEIMRQLKINEQHLEQLVEHANKDRWYVAFGSDVAANVLTAGAAWLLGRILK